MLWPMTFCVIKCALKTVDSGSYKKMEEARYICPIFLKFQIYGAFI